MIYKLITIYKLLEFIVNMMAIYKIDELHKPVRRFIFLILITLLSAFVSPSIGNAADVPQLDDSKTKDITFSFRDPGYKTESFY